MSSSDDDDQLTPEQEKLVQGSTVIPRAVAKVAPRTTLFSDAELTSMAYLSLRRAARNFNPEDKTPFDGYAYPCVFLDLMRAVCDENDRRKRELLSSFDDACEHLGRATDPGDLFKDSPSDSRRHVAEFASGIFAVIAARFLSDASLAPSAEEIEEHLDHERRRTKLWNAVAELGEDGRVLVLRYTEGLEWDHVAEALRRSNASVRRDHDKIVTRLGASLAALRVKNG